MQPEKHIFWYLISFQVEEEKEKKRKKENKSLIQTGAPPPQFFLLCKNLTCSFGFVANEPYRSITAAATL